VAKKRGRVRAPRQKRIGRTLGRGLELETKTLLPITPLAFVDAWSVVERPGAVEFAFYDDLLEGSPPVFRAIIPYEGLLNLSTSWERFHQEVRPWLEARGIAPIKPSVRAPAGTVTGTPTNIARAFRTGFEGLIEFYYVSPRMVYQVSSGSLPKLSATPVAALTMPTSLQVGMMEWLAGNIPSIAARVAEHPSSPERK
jgi:hypothetical protein